MLSINSHRFAPNASTLTRVGAASVVDGVGASGRVPALTVAPAVQNQALDTGKFRVAMRTDVASGKSYVEVTYADNPSHIVASTVPGEAFLSVGRGQETVSDRRGHIRVRDKDIARFEQQIVESMRPGKNNSIVLEGTFADAKTTRWQIQFAPDSDNRLSFVTQVQGTRHETDRGTNHADDSGLNRTTLHFASSPNERFHGFGMQGTHLDLKGHKVPIVVSEQGIGRGRQPLTKIANAALGVGGDAYMAYASVPQFITSDNRSAFLENLEYAEFDMRDNRRVSMHVHSNKIRGQLIAGTTPKALVSAYTEYAGRPRELPAWVHNGAIVGAQAGTDNVREITEKLEAAQVPVAGMWLQDWTGKRKTAAAEQLWWNWELDNDRYNGWNELRTDLQDKGSKVLTYINPMLVDVTGKPGVKRNLYQEALDNDYLVRLEDGEIAKIPNTTFSAGLVDLSNPKARAWYKQIIIDHVAETGSSGFMADYGEALPFEARMHDGSSGAQWHNRYPDEWAKLVREALDEGGYSDVVALHRSGSGGKNARSHAALQWSGDQLVTWDKHDGLRSALTTMISGGMSGFSLTHVDTGGYTAIDLPIIGARRGAELLKRWTELSAFTPMLRTHEGSLPAANAQVWDSADSLAHFAKLAKTFKALAPYRKSVVEEAARTGVPAIRHMWLEFPDDPVAGTLTDQYMFGPDLLVAPVLDPGETKVRAYIPAGAWANIFTGETIEPQDHGRWLDLAAPIGQPAVLYRVGSAGGEQARYGVAQSQLV